jgi:hypothetical protein
VAPPPISTLCAVLINAGDPSPRPGQLLDASHHPVAIVDSSADESLTLSERPLPGQHLASTPPSCCERPLLVKGEPGTGKTVLAQEVAAALGAAADRMARQVHHQGAAGPVRIRRRARLRDSQLGDARVHDIRNYIRKGKLWEAFRPRRCRCC